MLIICFSQKRSVLNACELFASLHQCDKFKVRKNHNIIRKFIHQHSSCDTRLLKTDTLPNKVDTHKHTHVSIICFNRKRNVLSACELYASLKQRNMCEVSKIHYFIRNLNHLQSSSDTRLLKNDTLPNKVNTHKHTHVLIICFNQKRSVLGACELFASL